VVNYNNLSSIVSGIGHARVLGWLGFSKITSDSSTVRAACVVHGGDRKDSFCLYKNTLIWRCFSNKCNEIHGSTFFSLVQAIFKCSFGEALSRFCSEFAVDRSLFCDDNIDENSKKDILFRSYIKNFSKKDYNISTIKLDTKPCNYFSLPEPEGGGPFGDDILNFFGVKKCYIDDFNIGRALIPIYDENNVLAGYGGRATVKVKQRKYLLTGNMVAGNILYNLNNVKKTLSDYIIVVEGFKSVWRLHEYGYDNAVACMGSLITPHQIRLLIGTLKKIVLFFDPDSAGIQGTIITNNKYSSMIPIIPIISEFDRDPADLTKEEADKLLIKYKSKKQSYV
jgi:hypothetical protein